VLDLVEQSQFDILEVIAPRDISYCLIFFSLHAPIEIVTADVGLAAHELGLLNIHPLLILAQHSLLVRIRERPYAPAPPADGPPKPH
jgi:hypothetical protein